MKPLRFGTAFHRHGVVGLALLLAGCGGGITSPDASRIVGSYLLTEVDGKAVPSTAPCPAAVSDGELSLVAGERNPALYSIIVYSSSTCDPNGVPSEATPVVHDAGSWSASGSDIRFVSSPYVRMGNHTGTVQTLSPTPIITVSFDGHAYAFREFYSRADLEGYLSISVVDQQGSGVAGALVVSHFPDGQVARVVSEANGKPFREGSQPGSTAINIAPPAGYALAPGQSSPVHTAMVTTGQTTPVVIVLMRTAP